MGEWQASGWLHCLLIFKIDIEIFSLTIVRKTTRNTFLPVQHANCCPAGGVEAFSGHPGSRVKNSESMSRDDRHEADFDWKEIFFQRTTETECLMSMILGCWNGVGPCFGVPVSGSPAGDLQWRWKLSDSVTFKIATLLKIFCKRLWDFHVQWPWLQKMNAVYKNKDSWLLKSGIQKTLSIL